MTDFEAVLLGIVQGLTEFLPVSSSGHLVVFQKLFGLVGSHLVFDVAVHLGTVLSILTFYRRPLKRVLFDVAGRGSQGQPNYGLNLILLIICGSLPTAIIGIGFKDFFESLFSSTGSVGGFFILTGVLLFLSRNKSRDTQGFTLDQAPDLQSLTPVKALLIGFAQSAAIAPGVSRSGSTIATALLLNVDRGAAAFYSFALSVPAILGAALLQMRDIEVWSAAQVQILLVGIFSAYLAGLFGLWLVLKFVSQGRLQLFSYYLWTLGPLVFFYL